MLVPLESALIPVNLDRSSLFLAHFMLRAARMQTIRCWTGLTDDRIRKV